MKTTTNPCYAQSTSNFTITTQSKPQSEFVYVSSSQPSAIVMISTQYQSLSDKEKLELLSNLSEWTYNKTSEIINQNK
jgi:PHD/YefM family antitoxin component YafN of YafNO toxin-antitoxin module